MTECQYRFRVSGLFGEGDGCGGEYGSLAALAGDGM